MSNTNNAKLMCFGSLVVHYSCARIEFDLLYDNVYSKLFTISKCKCSRIATVCVSSFHEHLDVHVIFGLNRSKLKQTRTE
jgi:hypothetical protein